MKEKIENGRLTLNQVKYLTLLDKLEQKRGAVQNIGSVRCPASYGKPFF